MKALGAGENQFGVSFANLKKLYMEEIEKKMQRSMRRPGLEKLALAAAGRIGNVELDHGETSCQTPDAAAYLRKAAEWKWKRKKPR